MINSKRGHETLPSYLRCLYPRSGSSWQQGRHLGGPGMSCVYSARATFHIDGLPLLWSARGGTLCVPSPLFFRFDLICCSYEGSDGRDSYLGRAETSHTESDTSDYLSWHTQWGLIDPLIPQINQFLPSPPELSGQPDAPRHLINRASLANGRRPAGWLTAAQRWAQKMRVSGEEGVHQKAIGSGRESEGCGGVRAYTQQSTESTQQGINSTAGLLVNKWDLGTERGFEMWKADGAINVNKWTICQKESFR